MSVLNFEDFCTYVETCERCNRYKSYDYYDRHGGCKTSCHDTIEEAFEVTDDNHLAELENDYYQKNPEKEEHTSKKMLTYDPKTEKAFPTSDYIIAVLNKIDSQKKS